MVLSVRWRIYNLNAITDHQNGELHKRGTTIGRLRATAFYPSNIFGHGPK